MGSEGGENGNLVEEEKEVELTCEMWIGLW